MPSQLTKVGALDIWQGFFEGGAGDNFVVGLYVNDLDFSWETTADDITECSAPGYSADQQSGLIWTPTGEGPPALFVSDPVVQVFTGNGGGQIVYGWFLLDSSNAILIFVYEFESPYVIPSIGGTFPFTPAITIASA